MMLSTKNACIYSGVSKPTFLLRKVPYSQGAKRGYKVYDPEILDEYFPDAPRVLPKKKKPSVGLVAATKVQFDVQLYQSQFTNILGRVKQIKGDDFQHDVASTLIESLIKSSVMEGHYFTELQKTPDDKDLFMFWERSTKLKNAITQRLGL